MHIRFLILSFLTLPMCLTAQRNCDYKIDTSKILSNENLDKFLLKFKIGNFKTFNNKNAIPKNVKKQLDCLARKFSIANPEQEYSCCCTSLARLPNRKLIFLSKSEDVLAMEYLKGGIGVSIHVVFIHFDIKGIVDLWIGRGSGNFETTKDIEGFITAYRKKGLEISKNSINL